MPVSRYHGVDEEFFLSSLPGDKLGLLDEQNLKFATSQVLRNGPRAGADAVRTQFAADGRSSEAPVTGESTKRWVGFSIARSFRNRSSQRYNM